MVKYHSQIVSKWLAKWLNIQSKFRKSCQKFVNSSAKLLILKLFLLLLKLITISEIKIKHPFFKVFFSF